MMVNFFLNLKQCNSQLKIKEYDFLKANVFWANSNFPMKSIFISINIIGYFSPVKFMKNFNLKDLILSNYHKIILSKV